MQHSTQKCATRRGLPLFLLLAAWLALAGGVARAQGHISAQVDQTQVSVGDPIIYTLTIESSSGQIDAQPLQPDFGGLTVRGGPSQSQQLSSINGAVRSTLSYSWQLEAPREGRYVIQPALVQMGGQTLSTSQLISITVSPSSVSASLPGSLRDAFISPAKTRNASVNQQLATRLFLRADVSKRDPYAGEPVIVTYRLYNDRVGLQSVQPQVTNDTPGAVTEELFSARSLDYKLENVDGRQFQVAQLYRAAITPNQAGDLTINNFGLDGAIQTRQQGNDPFNDFFNDSFFGGGIQMQIAAPQIKLRVKPLPAGAPADFSGTIGNYQVQTSIDRSQLTEDDLLTYRVTIQGSGAVDQINAPKPALGNDFDIVGQTPQTEKTNPNGLPGGRKVFEFVLRPQRSGLLEIPALPYTLFNPETGRYERREGKSQKAQVTPGRQGSAAPTAAPGNGAPAASSSSTAASAPHGGPQLTFLHTIDSKFQFRRPAPLMESPLFWLPQIVAAAALGWSWRLDQRRRHVNPAQARRAGAWRTFEKRLKGIGIGQHAATPEAAQQEAAALEQAVRALIADRFNLSAEGLTRPEIENLLLGEQMSLGNAQHVCDLLDACANVRYAPTTGSAAIKQWADEFEQTLREGLAS